MSYWHKADMPLVAPECPLTGEKRTSRAARKRPIFVRKNTQCCKTYIVLNRLRSKDKLLHHSVAYPLPKLGSGGPNCA